MNNQGRVYRQRNMTDASLKPARNGDAMSGKPSIRPRSGAYKRRFDLSFLVVAHLLLLPLWPLLWALISLAIWLGDRGPVFYSQKRVGKDGQTFTILKFRTMVPDAYHKGPAWTVPADPRVTRVGRFLRRTALDELPEILSIWKGDMSLVGPRALSVEEHKTLEGQIQGFGQRLNVLPGLTGLAQVYDRADHDEEKFRYDVQYLERMGPWLDLSLIALSVVNTLTARWDQRSAKPGKATKVRSSTDPAGRTDADTEDRQNSKPFNRQ